MGQDMVAMGKLPEDLGRKRRRNIIDALDKRMEEVGGVGQGLAEGEGPQSSGQNTGSVECSRKWGRSRVEGGG